MFEATCYDAMNDGEIVELIERLKERFPIVTDFGPRERIERQGIAEMVSFFAKGIFTPATDEEIERYRKDYAIWLERCEELLRNLHIALQKGEAPLLFAFQTSNDGTRPAADALVTIIAKGKFAIKAPSSRHDDDDEDSEDDKVEDTTAELPSPPSPPRGTWTTPSSLRTGLDAFLSSGFATPISPDDDHIFPDHSLHLETPRDPNAFYYKPERPEQPVTEFSLECKQWRHGVEPMHFEGQIFFGSDAETIAGSLECRIHAGNAADIVAKLVPIRIQVKHAKAYSIGQELVERVAGSVFS